MNYPMWDVPVIGGGWVIGAIAIFHILISHFAIGGGLYLPLAERKARREGREDWLRVLRGHSKFFLILTGVWGAVTGVAIWFAIGLVSPEGTSTLIHNFVFAWAIEWAFFFMELTSIAVYYYTWDKIPAKLHLKVGYFYAFTSFFSLVIINGILTFMLTPGADWLSVAGTGQESSAFWSALFNPTYLPSLGLRTLVCVSLAGVWALVTASRIDGDKEPRLKTEVIRYSVKWLIPAFFLMPIFFGWYLYLVPAPQRELLQLGVATVGAGTFTQVTRAVLVTVVTSATILAAAYFLAWRNPRGFKFGHALVVVLLALAATASTEQAREMLRKPYVVGEHMYSNGVRKGDVERLNREGYLTSSPWLRDAERLDPKSGAALEAGSTQQLVLGEMMMRGQCMACHTVNGYRSLRTLLAERDLPAIRSILKMLREQPDDSPYRAFMPPLVGTDPEVEALAVYLGQLVHPPAATAPATVAEAAK